MLLQAWATTRPTSASAKRSQRGAGAVAAARSPPIRPDVIVIEKTHARVMRSQRETPSIARPRGRLPVAMIWRQLSRRVAKPGVATAGSPGMAPLRSAMPPRLGAPRRRINRAGRSPPATRADHEPPVEVRREPQPAETEAADVDRAQRLVDRA